VFTWCHYRVLLSQESNAGYESKLLFATLKLHAQLVNDLIEA